MKEREGSKREGVRKMREKYKSQNKNCNYREWGTRRLLTAVGNAAQKEAAADRGGRPAGASGGCGCPTLCTPTMRNTKKLHTNSVNRE
jgi:hypothetical protein